ncbi:MAG: GNAT family N-acetyltransferase [Chloroflexota bacterium]
MNMSTDRLLIRDLEMGDLEEIHAFKSDREANQYTDFATDSLAETKAWLEGTIYHNELAPRSSHNCAIVLQETGEVLGWIGFGSAGEGKQAWGEIDFGYGLIREHWNHGYMTEALQGMIDFIFAMTDTQSLFGECDANNRASARVMEKSGLSLVARYQNEEDDSYTLRYQMTIQEWEG